jgi:hypothetical protein
MVEVDRRTRLIGWLEVIFADVQQLLLNDHIFWELQEIVERNDEFLRASGLFTRFIASAYAQSAAIGIRRQIKANTDSVSIMRFLKEIQTYPDLVSRAHYMSLYKGLEDWRIELGQHDFDKVAGTGSKHLPPELVRQQIQEVNEAAENIEHYVDRRVAHHDKRGLARPMPKFDDIRDTLKVLESMVILYWRLLKGPSMSTMTPTILNDWKDIFRFAWEPTSPRPGREP